MYPATIELDQNGVLQAGNEIANEKGGSETQSEKGRTGIERNKVLEIWKGGVLGERHERSGARKGIGDFKTTRVSQVLDGEIKSCGARSHKGQLYNLLCAVEEHLWSLISPKPSD